MRKLLAVLAVVVLLGGTVGAADALPLSKGRAERAVVKRVKAKYYAVVSSAYASCHRLTGSRFGCTYTYFTRASDQCEGGASVRQFSYGLEVRLSRPRNAYGGGGC